MGLMGQAVEAECRLSSQPTQVVGRTELAGARKVWANLLFIIFSNFLLVWFFL
jgi:hypothetical protein